MDLADNILKEIKKTGYPTELKIAKKLRSLGLNIEENEYYIDRDLNKGREIDIRAYTSNSFDHGSTKVSIHLFLSIEIKMSVEPWVIFTSDKTTFDRAGYTLLHHSHNIDNSLISANDINRFHSLKSMKRVGRTEYVPFKKDGSQIYSAILSSVKSSIAEHFEAREHKEIYNDGFVFLYTSCYIQWEYV